jgi:single-strand DNA-binding protein
MDTWEDKATGQKRSKLKVVAENLQFLPDGKGGPGGGTPSNGNGGGGYPARPAQAQAPQRSGPPQGGSAAPVDEYHEDDDIPF